ncbi:hypothetical protein TVAGG3_0295920 [Trichomonas vaginalis G3]|uniref:hypothetical protein n=1 Tax=Trichomonas vaginalis (strain ATCC PRA-98 / G3) TaxID=412133 RepID=UPI0021E54B2B|nr:hypothetical protein TVAGG3_0295920 [Trichomonas vaginalis G3]KAI5527605.1 hypothetical protein TVAGG3_0295920 [Trichomonas vaginalis G3]
MFNATAVASEQEEWTFKVNATKDHNKTKLLVVVETDADHKSNLGTGNVTYSSTVPHQLSRVFNTTMATK